MDKGEDVMLYIIGFVSFYVFTGFGFSLAAWLQAAEKISDKGGDWSKCWRQFWFFVLIWPIIALYCYRAEVKKSISKIDINKI